MSTTTLVPTPPHSSLTTIVSTSTSSPTAGVLASPGSFYKNLFYILIGLLGAFGIVSFLSLLRARKRRRRIFAEAERLGLLVPGLPGYVPMRDRDQLTWTKADGTSSPDWWEIGKAGWGIFASSPSAPESEKEVAAEKDMDVYVETAAATALPFSTEDDFFPLAVLPPYEPPAPPVPNPKSNLPYFPNHLAYLPANLMPTPSRFISEDASCLDNLGGERIDLITIIRMPQEERERTGQVEVEGEDISNEWGGVEFGIVRIGVEK
ncbi:hypothetical protein P7C73_g2691, partial [Tremellales sp. Uapishka_1]